MEKTVQRSNANITELTYMQQIKAVCSYYPDCTMKNRVNCPRCIKAIEQQKKLLEMMGLTGETVEQALNVIRSVANLNVPQTSQYYWCFKCKRNHRLTSQIGKTHSKLS